MYFSIANSLFKFQPIHMNLIFYFRHLWISIIKVDISEFLSTKAGLRTAISFKLSDLLFFM